MSYFPAFFDLKGKAAIVVGATPVALERVRLALAAGATVRVFANELSAEGRLLVASPGVAWLPGEAARDDFQRAALAFVATGDCDRDRAAAETSRAAGVPVNVADQPELCDFIMPAIVRRGDIAIGISTGGAAPALAKFVRESIERVLPARLGDLARFAGKLKQRVRDLFPKPEARRQVWQELIEGSCGQAVLAGRPAEAQRHLLKLLNARAEAPAEKGVVHIVGAGPGDPDLLTLRAVRALQSADVILIDDLVSPAVLDFARREAKKMMVGKTGHGPACKQSEINDLMIKLAKSGKRVVRLKGGDPMIFGRAGEEIAACRAANIPVDVVPGISAAQGAASRLLVSLTHRAQARRVQYVTGHDRDGQLPADIDWQSLADPAVTTVVYMPKKTLRLLSERAIAQGLDPATPAVAVANATRPDQTVVAATIATIADEIEASRLGSPVLVMIGRVLADVAAAQTSAAAAAATHDASAVARRA